MDDPVFKNNLQQRLFNFSVHIIQSVRLLPNGKEYEVISRQVLQSASSCGANYEEALGAVSKADFTNKIAIALKEMRETNYWIRLIVAITENNQDWIRLKQESWELTNILGSIRLKTSVQREFPPR